MTTSEEAVELDPTHMNPLTGQASVKSRNGAPAEAIDAEVTSSTEQAAQTPQRSRGIFPWWKVRCRPLQSMPEPLEHGRATSGCLGRLIGTCSVLAHRLQASTLRCCASECRA